VYDDVSLKLSSEFFGTGETTNVIGQVRAQDCRRHRRCHDRPLLVGNDKGAEDLKRILTETGVSTARLVTDRSRPTISKTRVVSGRQQFFRIDRAAYHPGSVALKSTAVEMAATWRRMGERVVFTNGCFDLIHAGHIELLSLAAREGNRLIVGLNSHASVRRPKGPTRPIQTEADRARIVGALRVVDLVVLFDDLTPLVADRGLIEAISLDVLVKGADYSEDQVIGGELVKARGGRIALFPLIEGRSATKIVERTRS
jgi:rfaE bifunctional protein nucleotidyltransferase chain/domain